MLRICDIRREKIKIKKKRRQCDVRKFWNYWIFCEQITLLGYSPQVPFPVLHIPISIFLLVPKFETLVCTPH